MKKVILAQKVLASVLAIGLGGFVLPLAAQANSGLKGPEDVNGPYGKYYVGTNGAENNVVVIDSDLPDNNAGVIGGYAESDIVTNNTVTISGGTVTGVVYGGYSFNGDATKNEVSISGGEVGYVRGGDSFNGDATGNEVSISGGEVGYVRGGDGLEAIGNSVNISGGTVKGDVHGGRSDNKTEGNSVNISGGTVKGDVHGGRSENKIEDNSVNISGGTVTGNVYGGYSITGTVTGNSITLSAAADVSQANLYGGKGYVVENNKLVINGWSGTVKSINNFNGAEGGIEVKAIGGGLDLAVGKITNFITATGLEDGDKTIYIENSYIQENSKQVKDIQAGVALIVSGDIDMDDKNIYINSTSVRINDQTAITTESRAAAAAFVNQGAEAVSDSINSLQGAEAGISTFATVSGNNSKYDTGSYVDINGWNGIVGVAKTKDLNAGKFSYGAFFENGGGNYNTYNDFNGTSFRGDGNVVYNGGGLLMRYEQEDGVYTEASLRAGTAKNEVSNALEFTGNRYGFKTENAYYGAHIGIGKIIKLDNGKAWDIYGKYFHTHHEGDSVKIANDVFDFDSVDSDKLRIGARFSEKQGEKLTSYYGLAWEYEFSGDAGGTANHYAMYTPSLEGSTVIGEVGFRYTPGKESPWYFDANVRGYAGMQEGISGSVQAVYSF